MKHKTDGCLNIMKTTPITIEVCKRMDDSYHAQLKDHPEIWDCGNSIPAAIGNLIQTHSEQLNIVVDFIQDKFR